MSDNLYAWSDPNAGTYNEIWYLNPSRPIPVIYTKTTNPDTSTTLYDANGNALDVTKFTDDDGIVTTIGIYSANSSIIALETDSHVQWSYYNRDSSQDIIASQYVSNLSDGTNTYIIKDAEARAALAGKQETLVSGTNIKTVSSISLLGSGDIPFPTVDQTYSASSANAQSGIAVASGISNAVSGKVDKISTANIVYGVDPDGNQSSYEVSTSAIASTIVRRTTAGQVSVAQTPTSNVHATSKKYVDDGLGTKQDTLVSGTNIKTVNSTSLLGSGDISIIGLPSQTGQSGKYLTTDGTNASWATSPGSGASYDSTNKRLVL